MNPQSLRDRCAIAGIGETAYVRRSERPFKELQLEAITKAIADAGMVPADIDGIITDQLVTPALMPVEDVLASLKMADVGFVSYTPPVGMGITMAPLVAAMAIEHGIARNVLVYFGVDWGSSPGGPYAYHEHYRHKLSFEIPYAFFGQPVYFAAMARRYQHEFGLSDDQMADALGAIAVACRKHALLNPNAQMRKPMSMEDYRRSPMVATPLRVADCCLVTDGAGAYVVTSAERGQDCPHPPVYVMGVGYAALPVAGDSFFSQNPDYVSITAATAAASRALAMAGVSLKDVDFAEIYDCFTISVLMELEDIGFCGKGEAAQFVGGGRIELGGELPINTHGGLLSQGYILGMNHIVEAVRQLRHEAGAGQVAGAEIGLVSAAPDREHATLILRR